MGVLHIFGHPLLLVFGVLVTWLPCDESDGDHVLKAPFTEFKNASIMFGQVHTGLCEHSSQDSVPARALQGGSSAGGGSASAVRVVVSAIMVMVPVVVFVVVALNYETGVVDQLLSSRQLFHLNGVCRTATSASIFFDALMIAKFACTGSYLENAGMQTRTMQQEWQHTGVSFGLPVLSCS